MASSEGKGRAVVETPKPPNARDEPPLTTQKTAPKEASAAPAEASLVSAEPWIKASGLPQASVKGNPQISYYKLANGQMVFPRGGLATDIHQQPIDLSQVQEVYDTLGNQVWEHGKGQVPAIGVKQSAIGSTAKQSGALQTGSHNIGETSTEHANSAAGNSTPTFPHKLPISDPSVLSHLDDLSQSARQRIYLRNKGRFNAGLDPLDFVDLGIVVAAEIAKGTITMANHVNELVRRYGPEIRPFATQIYNRGLDVIHRVVTQRPSGHGAFGPEYGQYSGDSSAAITHLALVGKGAVPDVLRHPNIRQPITLPFGKQSLGLNEDGWYGAAKIIQKHPTAAFHLQDWLPNMRPRSLSTPTKTVWSNGNRIAVINDEYNQQPVTWLNSMFETNPPPQQPLAPPGTLPPTLPPVIKQLYDRGRRPEGGIATVLNTDPNAIQTRIPELEAMADAAKDRRKQR